MSFEAEKTIMRIRLHLFSLLILSAAMCGSGAMALDFPEGCRSPSGIVEKIEGIGTERATMSGRSTLPDIIYACHLGYVTQGTIKPAECVESFKSDGFEEVQLFAQADCKKGAIQVNGNLNVFPIEPSCAIGGFQAIKAFKILCPNSDLQLEETAAVKNFDGKRAIDRFWEEFDNCRFHGGHDPNRPSCLAVDIYADALKRNGYCEKEFAPGGMNFEWKQCTE